MNFLPDSDMLTLLMGATLAVKMDGKLFLRADSEVAYGVVAQVMGEVKGAGIDRLGIVAEQSSGEKKR